MCKTLNNFGEVGDIQFSHALKLVGIKNNLSFAVYVCLIFIYVFFFVLFALEGTHLQWINVYVVFILPSGHEDSDDRDLSE